MGVLDNQKKSKIFSRKYLTTDDKQSILGKHKRKGKMKMEKNYDILAELNTRGRKIWNVFDDSGNWLGAVGSTDNNRQTALRYAQRKYGRNIELVFREWKN